MARRFTEAQYATNETDYAILQAAKALLPEDIRMSFIGSKETSAYGLVPIVEIGAEIVAIDPIHGTAINRHPSNCYSGKGMLTFWYPDPKHK